MSRSLFKPICFVAALLFSPAQARAQALTAEALMDMPLEQLAKVEVLITGSSKYAEKESETASVVEVITAEDIRTYGYRTLADALNGLHGLYKNNDRNFTTMGVRGFLFTGTANSRILITVDGRRMNENVFDSAYVGEEFTVDMDLVDHIEYISGPGSSVYGANAMMGVVNVVTKKGSDINGTQIAASAGSYNTGAGRATYGKKLDNGADVLISASGFQSDGVKNLYYPEFDDPSTNNGIAHGIDGERAQRLFAKAEMEGLTYAMGYVNRLKVIPTHRFSSLFNDPGLTSEESHFYNELKYNKSLDKDVQIEFKAFYHKYGNMAHFPYEDVLPRYILFDEYGGDWFGGEANIVTTEIDGHKIVLGGEFQWDINQFLFARDKFGVYQNSNRSGMRSGLYLQDAISLTDKLVLNAGVRLDQHHMIEKAQVNPRIGLIWNPKESTTFKLLYGSAFRAPNVMERDYDAFNSWTANPNNTEEHIKNYEGVVEWRSGDGVKLSGSVFYNQFTDVLSKDYESTHPTYHMFTNTGNMTSVGVELGAEKRWENGREVKVNYTHSEYTRHTGTSWGAVDSPKDVAKLRYAEPLFDDRAKLGMEGVFVGNRTTLYYSEEDPYYFANANLSAKDLFFGADFSLGVYNLFNSSVNMIGGPDVAQDVIPMNGRSFLFTVQKTF